MPRGKRGRFSHRLMVYLTAGVVGAVAFTGISFYVAELHKPPEMIPAFLQIAPGLYRGGQPTGEGFEYLKSIGIKTVLNFRKEKQLGEWEKEAVEQNGMEYVNIPWQIYETPNPEVAEKYLDILEDPSNRPLFIHCQHGVDRTGIMAALYYIKYEDLPPKEALQKAGKIFPPHKRWFFFTRRQYRLFTKEFQNALPASTPPSEK